MNLRGALLATVMAAGLFVPAAHALPLPEATAQNPYLLLADSVQRNENLKTYTASGHVEIRHEGRVLLADSVTYNEQTAKIFASGHVTLMDEMGNVWFGDKLDLSQDLTDGFISNIKGRLSDNSRFAARKAVKKGDDLTLEKAVYSPCDLCRDNPEKPPLWQIKAQKVKRDGQKHDIIYNNASMEIGGVPVAWTPYLSHPDPTVKQRSGFLAPRFGWNSNLGFLVRTYYYWGIRPDMDATLEATATKNQGPLAGGEFRKRFEHGKVRLRTALTQSDYTKPWGQTDYNKTRGYLFTDGQFDLNQTWRTDFDVRRTTDDAFLRQYKYSNDDILRSHARAEGFSGRNYTVGSLWAFQDIRPENHAVQPNVLPWGETFAYGEPGGTLGGRWSLYGGVLGLARNPGEDVRRGSVKAGWMRRFISKTGLVADTEATTRGDLYWINSREDSAGAGNKPDSNGTEGRLFPQAQVTVSYPMEKPLTKGSVLLSPIAALTTAPRMGHESRIPNEDSVDVELDSTNLFDPSRFPGSDRVEGSTRATYGLKTGLYKPGGYVSFFLGQSYRLTKDIIFPAGSGLEKQGSDLVGQLEAVPGHNLDIDYRFRLDDRTLADKQHELVFAAGPADLRLAGSYLFTRNVEGTGLGHDRQELTLGVESLFRKYWTISTGGRASLGPQGDGLLSMGGGLKYSDECFTLSGTANRDLTNPASGIAATSVYFQIGFKNLGEVKSPDLLGDVLKLNRSQ